MTCEFLATGLIVLNQPGPLASAIAVIVPERLAQNSKGPQQTACNLGVCRQLFEPPTSRTCRNERRSDSKRPDLEENAAFLFFVRIEQQPRRPFHKHPCAARCRTRLSLPSPQVSGPIVRPGDLPDRSQPTLTSIFFGRSSARFGMRTVNTPCFRFASIFSVSSSPLKAKLRR